MTISVEYRTIELKFEAENVNLIHLNCVGPFHGQFKSLYLGSILNRSIFN